MINLSFLLFIIALVKKKIPTRMPSGLNKKDKTDSARARRYLYFENLKLIPSAPCIYMLDIQRQLLFLNGIPKSYSKHALLFFYVISSIGSIVIV